MTIDQRVKLTAVEKHNRIYVHIVHCTVQYVYGHGISGSRYFIIQSILAPFFMTENDIGILAIS